jgi:hypothetical protein
MRYAICSIISNKSTGPRSASQAIYVAKKADDGAGEQPPSRRWTGRFAGAMEMGTS